jgi:hypothetical protein
LLLKQVQNLSIEHTELVVENAAAMQTEGSKQVRLVVGVLTVEKPASSTTGFSVGED